jgi:hypothetical protein
MTWNSEVKDVRSNSVYNEGVFAQIGLGYLFPVTGLYIWEMRDRSNFAKDRGLPIGSTKDCLIRGLPPILSELAIILTTILIMGTETKIWILDAATSILINSFRRKTWFLAPGYKVESLGSPSTWPGHSISHQDLVLGLWEMFSRSGLPSCFGSLGKMMSYGSYRWNQLNTAGWLSVFYMSLGTVCPSSPFAWWLDSGSQRGARYTPKPLDWQCIVVYKYHYYGGSYW